MPGAVDAQVKQVIDSVKGRITPRFSIPIAPLFNINLKKEETDSLRSGKFPGSVWVEGEAGWEVVFGKPINTLSWQWPEVASGLMAFEETEYQLAQMCWEAYKYKRVKFPSIPSQLRDASGNSLGLYRFTLNRFEEVAEDHRFRFTAASLLAPFDCSDSQEETMLYHIYNAAWSWRRRLFEHDRKALESALQLVQGRERRIEQILREMRYNLRALAADAQLRGLDREGSILKAYLEHQRPEIERIMHTEWPRLWTQFYTLINQDNPDPARVLDYLAQMEPLNRCFYGATLEALCKRWNNGT
jgi:hypothetical protein